MKGGQLSIILTSFICLLYGCSEKKVNDGIYNAFVESYNVANKNDDKSAVEVEIKKGIVKRIIFPTYTLSDKEFDMQTMEDGKIEVYTKGDFVYTITLLSEVEPNVRINE